MYPQWSPWKKSCRRNKNEGTSGGLSPHNIPSEKGMSSLLFGERLARSPGENSISTVVLALPSACSMVTHEQSKEKVVDKPRVGGQRSSFKHVLSKEWQGPK